MLQTALAKEENHLPVDRVSFGDAFKTLLPTLNLDDIRLAKVRQYCRNYIMVLCKQLLARLPSNVCVIAKLRHFIPKTPIARTSRPTFDQLPLELAGTSSFDREQLENQWLMLGTLTFLDICPHFEEYENVDKVDIVHFWSCLLDYSDAGGKHPFKALATFVIEALTLPVSYAVVERVFSFMNAIKDKQRNRLQMIMLEALLRMRVHLKVHEKCCRDFQPTTEMYMLFNSSMYQALHSQTEIYDAAYGLGVEDGVEEMDVEEDEVDVDEETKEAAIRGLKQRQTTRIFLFYSHCLRMVF